jgi:hypothetical protein
VELAEIISQSENIFYGIAFHPVQKEFILTSNYNYLGLYKFFI